MGFLKKVFQAATTATQPEVRTVVFDQDWQDTMEMLRTEFAGKKSQTSVHIDVPDALCEDISSASDSHEPSARVPYSDSKVPINNVGESFRQEDLRELCGNAAGEDMPWLSGFLMPEILNPYDKYAVGIHAIMISSIPEPSTKKFTVAQVGYMDKESAKKVHKKILNLLGKDQYVPLLIRMTGGTKEKPNYGAFPYVMTDKIKFE